MENLIVIGILLVLVGAAVLYIWKEKKKGTRCIGCPAAGCCQWCGRHRSVPQRVSVFGILRLSDGGGTVYSLPQGGGDDGR